MRRTKTIKKADAILTADWHLQDKQPIARLDDFWKTQWQKVDFISELQKKHGCPVIHSGDLYDHWKPSPELLAKTIEHLPEAFHTIYGNHDLPHHNLELKHKCGIYVLEKAGKLKVLPGTHWGQEIIESDIFYPDEPRILVWHIMTYQGQKPWYNCKDPKAMRLLRKHKEYDLIVTGHNHKPFVKKYKNRLLVNPGSIFRMHADQINHTPRVYLWYSDTNEVIPVFLPINENAITTEHIDEKKERAGRIDAFINSLQTEYDESLSFEDNLEKVRQANNISDKVIQIIYKYLPND